VGTGAILRQAAGGSNANIPTDPAKAERAWQDREMAIGRFAPSPTGALHLGNLRTALLAWLFARSAESRFLVRMEDLDPATSAREHEAGQVADLRALGLDWDGAVVRQSERRDRHEAALAELVDRGLTYPCYCSRKEIREAASAPHARPGVYPGTCRELTVPELAERTAHGRPPALRLRGDGVPVTIDDRLHGEVVGSVDDIVLRRNDGIPAYHVAVVVDDDDQGVEEVVRGDDLLEATPSQAHLLDLLGRPRPLWAHVPLAVGVDGARLAKRHGAVTLADLEARGIGADEVRGRLAASLGLVEPGEPAPVETLLERFDPSTLPRTPWIVDPSR
jgi:glutamyl-tRNA synthetase